MGIYDLDCTRCEETLSETLKDGFWDFGWYQCKNERCTAHDVKIYVKKCKFCENKVKLVKNSTDGLEVGCFSCSIRFT